MPRGRLGYGPSGPIWAQIGPAFTIAATTTGRRHRALDPGRPCSLHCRKRRPGRSPPLLTKGQAEGNRRRRRATRAFPGNVFSSRSEREGAQDRC
jgi:hypothetical protein